MNGFYKIGWCVWLGCQFGCCTTDFWLRHERASYPLSRRERTGLSVTDAWAEPLPVMIEHTLIVRQEAQICPTFETVMPLGK